MVRLARRDAHRAVAMLLTAALLAACGGGREDDSGRRTAGDGPGDGEAVAIELDAPQAVAGTRQIALRWRTRGAPSVYSVLVQPAAGDAFVAVDGATVDGDGARFTRIEAWRYDWPTARVRVRACTAAAACADSNEQPLLAALEGGTVDLRADPLSRGPFFDFRLGHDGRRLVLDSQPLTVHGRGADDRWQLDRPAPGKIGSVALSGDGNTLAVGLSQHRGTVGGIGAPEDEPPPDPLLGDDRGAVAVYVRGADGGWQQQVFIKPDTPIAREGFGLNVALSGDGNRLAVGNRQALPGPGAPRLYLYERDGGTWRLATTIADRPQRTLESPMTLSADGRTIALRVSGGPPEGYPFGVTILVHVYRQCACQQRWEFAAELKSIRDIRMTSFNYDEYAQALSLSADGKVLAVGAPGDGDGGVGGGVPTDPPEGAVSSGAVYLYGEGPDRRWQQRALLKTASAPAYDLVGSHVQLRADGRALLTSACGRAATDNGLRRVHRADAQPPALGNCPMGPNFYVFEADAGGWRHTAAGLVPNPNPFYGQVRASADLGTIAGAVTNVTAPATVDYAVRVY